MVGVSTVKHDRCIPHPDHRRDRDGGAPLRLRQQELREIFATQPHLDRRAQRIARAAFDNAGIDHRHTALAALGAQPEPDALRVRDAHGTLQTPTTAERAKEYRRLAPPLFAEASRKALAEAALHPGEVTHVITVSCTGAFAPGPDVLLVRELGLPVGVERYHLGFVGCAAALPALRAADRCVRARPDAVVLVVCVELCSLHIRVSADPEQIVAASLFADGAAAAIVRIPRPGERGLELADFATSLIPEGESEMTWDIGDTGFEMRLTAQVPRIVGRSVRAAALDLADVDGWAIHPGGRSILDRVAAGLAIDEERMAPSRGVLRDHGNMSSATILFILRVLLHGRQLRDGARIGALAFGPGLTLERAELRLRSGAEDS